MALCSRLMEPSADLRASYATFDAALALLGSMRADVADRRAARAVDAADAASGFACHGARVGALLGVRAPALGAGAYPHGPAGGTALGVVGGFPAPAARCRADVAVITLRACLVSGAGLTAALARVAVGVVAQSGDWGHVLTIVETLVRADAEAVGRLAPELTAACAGVGVHDRHYLYTGAQAMGVAHAHARAFACVGVDDIVQQQVAMYGI